MVFFTLLTLKVRTQKLIIAQVPLSFPGDDIMLLKL